MINSQKALETLIEGNKRFLSDEPIFPNRSKATRLALLEGQKPFAVVICCSDSRVAPETIFDVGLGDLFIIRNAGHTISKEALGSIEYPVEFLGVKLVMVLGHDNCGAVKAAVDYKKGDEMSPHLKSIVNQILPAVEKAKESQEIDNDKLLDLAIKNNVTNTVTNVINSSNSLTKLVNDETVKVVGANYNMTTGKVSVFE